MSFSTLLYYHLLGNCSLVSSYLVDTEICLHFGVKFPATSLLYVYSYFPFKIAFASKDSLSYILFFPLCSC